MRAARLLSIVFLVTASFNGNGQNREISDTTVVGKLRREGLNRSAVMQTLRHITDIHGPRLTNSPGFHRSAAYAKDKLTEWGVSNVHFDQWDENFGRGWSIRRFSLQCIDPVFFPLIAYPKAWSPGVKGEIKAEVVYLDIRKEEDLRRYHGKLKGKIVLFSLPAIVKPGYTPEATRLSDSVLLQLANAVPGESNTGRRFTPPGEPQRLAWLKWQLCEREGAVAILEASPGARSKDGTLMVGQAIVPYPPDHPYSQRKNSWDADAPSILPQLVVASEQYNRLVRLVEEGAKVNLLLQLETGFTPAAPGYNIIGEIPGTDLRDEVVMIGAHFDSWHAGTGTTDNGVGAAVMMEAIRLLKSLGVSPRRTIRIALWGGEEQGLLGSRSYVRRTLGEYQDRRYPLDSLKYTPAGEKFSVYFNSDLGNGKYRGIYTQGNEAAASIFRQWMRPFEKSGTATVTLKNITGTDHLSFDAVGLPGFQFIQDPLEYGTRTYHSNMDVFDKAVEADLKHNAIVTAVFAWFAANRAEKMPRK